MYKLVPITTALVLALGAAQPALAQDHGDRGGDKHEGGGQGGGHQDRGNGGGHGDSDRNQDRSGEDGRGDSGNGGERHADRAGPRIVEMVREDARRADRDGERDIRREVGRQAFQTRDGRPVVYFQRERDRGLIAGCPPGLAKRDNGCLPPGQARQIARAAAADRYASLWGARGDGDTYRYDNGYVYRMNQQGSLLGYLPVLGGALAPGAAWPAQYAWQPAPDYYSSYFGLPQNQDYRYADGALYGVNPQTQMISQVAALLTGQNPSVGQPMPSGYDVYNVPSAYRDRYADNANAMYRYNDGYVYQADPKTQLITAVIQLLT